MTICPNCGSEAEDDAVFCEECGYKINETQLANIKKQDKPKEKKKIRFIKKKK